MLVLSVDGGISNVREHGCNKMEKKKKRLQTGKNSDFSFL